MTIPSDNMKLWAAVEQTDPQYTKKVATRGGFTAIGAQYQIKMATEQWGPYGYAWGVNNCIYSMICDKDGHPIEMALDAVFYYPPNPHVAMPTPKPGDPIPASHKGVFSISTDMAYKPGNDTRKKLLTDLTTKALSKLGFNADVFMGKFDDNKYLEAIGAKPKASDTDKPILSDDI